MTTLRFDFVLRALERTTAAVAAVASSRRVHSYEASLSRLREACVEALGMELDVLTRFEASCVAPLFATPEQLRALALLVSEKAALLEAHGEPLQAACEAGYAARLEEESRKRFRGRDVWAAARLQTVLAEALTQRMRTAPAAASSAAEGG